MKIWLLFLFVLALGIDLRAQSPAEPLGPEARNALERWEDSLALLSHTVFSDTSATDRFGACRDLITGLSGALKVRNAFRYPFERLEHISIQYPADSSFRVFTWQLYVDEETYRYFGAIQMNEPELRLFPLADRSEELVDPENAVLPPDRWYGSVYYRLHQVDGKEGRHYLLFGYDGFSFFRRRKVLDVLHFDEAGRPRFGKPVFVHPAEGQKPETTRSRLVLEYSAEASVRLNYDPTLDMVVFDHLLLLPGQHGEGPVGLPDGSYEGYHWKNGQWNYVEKIWDQVSEQAPRPFPVLEGKRKDLFGNQ